MKKTFLTVVLALVLGLGANAQTSMFDWEDFEDGLGTSRSEMFDWDYSLDDYSGIGMFDMSIFTDLLDWSNGVDVINDWVSDFELFRDIDIPGLPGHGITDNVDGSPLGSGIAVLVSLGAAYAFAKRRKED